METLAERLKAARSSAKLSQHELATAVGIKQPSLQAIEAGTVQGTKHILGLAKALHVNPEWLLHGEGPQRAASSTRLPLPAMSAPGDDTISILGTAEGGPDGLVEWSGDVIATILRPPYLAGAKGAYVLYVTGTSMEPRYRHGEVLFVHPGKPYAAGDFVVVQHYAGSETPAAWVKQFVKRDSKNVTLRQFNPAKEIKLPVENLRSIHKIVGTWEF